MIAQSTTPLWSGTEATEKNLILGKINNLRIAIRKVNRVEVPAGEIFSFWTQIGRPTRLKGYVRGRELREGCIIPNIGGGLCQLSNALYDAALKSGFEIIERHAHTQVIPGSLAEIGRDATVFWNYVDLRFKSAFPFRIEAELTKDDLIIKFVGKPSESIHKTKPNTLRLPLAGSRPHSCETCGVQGCFRNYSAEETNALARRTAYLVDKYQREFDDYISWTKQSKDLLFLPLNGKLFRKSNYAWSTNGFYKVRESRIVSFWRSYRSRKLAQQGAERQRNLLKFNEELAKSFASRLSYDISHIVVTQSLLPFLWRDGHLGGRTFDVLMTSLPMRELQERLDFAFKLHPDSRTLRDFRADESLIRMETEALKNAHRIITPHTEIASLFPDRAVLIDWAIPVSKSEKVAVQTPTFTILFPGPTAGRKGAFELREAIKGLPVKLLVLGADLEGEPFWEGFNVQRANRNGNWLETIDAVVLPAFVEHDPRLLLTAISRGIPVIASPACGLDGLAGVINVPFGNSMALRSRIKEIASEAMKRFEKKLITS